jgi:SAM-dependent methyltransferase
MNAASKDDAVSRWNELHAVPRFSPQYPSELVIRWTFRNFPRDRAGEFRLLDVGAGGGRHTVFWAREGFQAAATDVSQLAVAQTLEWAQREHLTITAETAAADALPFADESFDGLLSFGVLYYLPYERMKTAIAEIRRVLKPGGRAFVMVKSDADSRRIEATQTGPYSYRIGEPKDGAYWAAEAGLVLVLMDRAALQECFALFSDVSIDRSSVTSSNGRFVDDEWLIQLRK